MKKKTKITALALCVILVFSMLAACGSQTAAPASSEAAPAASSSQAEAPSAPAEPEGVVGRAAQK